MLSIVGEASRAILIGTSDYPADPSNLPSIEAIGRNLDTLKRLLIDPHIVGLPPENIITILNEPKASDLAVKLARLSRVATDTLIVYYAGHGIIGKNSSQLFLGVHETTCDDAEFNGLDINDMKKVLYESTARKKVLILDCCFSGRALQIMSTTSSLLQAGLDIRGTYAIASAPANLPAIAPPGATYTAFTGELVRVLDEGIDNQKEEITLQELYDAVRQGIRSQPTLPEPQAVNLQDAWRLTIARNRRFSASVESKIARLEKELTSRMDDQDTRLRSVVERLNQAMAQTVSTPDPKDLDDSSSFTLPPITRRMVSVGGYAAIALALPFILAIASHPNAPIDKSTYSDLKITLATMQSLLVSFALSALLIPASRRVFELVFPRGYMVSAVLRLSVIGLILLILISLWPPIFWAPLERLLFPFFPFLR